MVHAYIPNPWKKPICDAKVDDTGQIRLCGESPAAAVHRVAGESTESINAVAANAAAAYLDAHASLVEAGITPARPAAARKLAEAWLELNRAVAIRKARLA